MSKFQLDDFKAGDVIEVSCCVTAYNGLLVVDHIIHDESSPSIDCGCEIVPLKDVERIYREVNK